MDQTFLQLISLIISLSNQVQNLQAQNAALLALQESGSQNGSGEYVPLLKAIESQPK